MLVMDAYLNVLFDLKERPPSNILRILVKKNIIAGKSGGFALKKNE